MKVELLETKELVEEVAKKSMENEKFIHEIAEKVKNAVATPWMNKKETCAYLNICYNTLSEWIEELNFPVCQIGNRYFFKPNDVDNWMKKHKKK